MRRRQQVVAEFLRRNNSRISIEEDHNSQSSSQSNSVAARLNCALQTRVDCSPDDPWRLSVARRHIAMTTINSIMPRAADNQPGVGYRGSAGSGSEAAGASFFFFDRSTAFAIAWSGDAVIIMLTGMTTSQSIGSVSPHVSSAVP